MRYISVIIVAAGESKRLKSKIRKPYLILQGKPVIQHSIELFSSIPEVKEIVIAIHSGDSERIQEALAGQPNKSTPIKIVFGGATRAVSVFEALKATSTESDIVLIHDAARPFVRRPDVINLIEEIGKSGAAILATPVKDTIKRIEEPKYRKPKNLIIKETITPRESLWAAQTPQGFRKEILVQAYKKLGTAVLWVTDDASLCEKIDVPVSIVPGSEDNIKITTKADIK